LKNIATKKEICMLAYDIARLTILILHFYRSWLIAVGRDEEAKLIVTKFANSSKKAFTDEEWNKMVQIEKNKVGLFSNVGVGDAGDEADFPE